MWVLKENGFRSLLRGRPESLDLDCGLKGVALARDGGFQVNSFLQAVGSTGKCHTSLGGTLIDSGCNFLISDLWNVPIPK